MCTLPFEKASEIFLWEAYSKSKGHQGCGIPLNGGIVNKLFGRGISWSRFIILLGIYLKAFVPTRPMTGSLNDSVLSDEDLISLLKAGVVLFVGGWGGEGVRGKAWLLAMRYKAYSCILQLESTLLAVNLLPLATHDAKTYFSGTSLSFLPKQNHS